MPENRPQGRKTKVSGQSTGAYRRGEGQNTGPVGSAGSNPNRPSRPAGQGMSRAAKAGGGGGIIIVIILALLFLMKGGGLGGLLGGGDDSALSGGSAYNDVSANPYANLLAGASYSGSAQEVNSGAVDTSVASGARDKYTRILGNQRDEVTILIYMCGTDLESRSGMATKDLTEMTRATIGPNVHVLVYTGGCARWNNSVISSRQNQIYEVQSGGLKRVVDNDGTGAMTDPATLTRFIQWGAKNYPANRYMLILWDHGGGSVSGYGYDENNKRSGSMPLEGIDRALKAGGIQFDIVGFDACLMATVETGLMLGCWSLTRTT